jgi:hypothetical protein
MPGLYVMKGFTTTTLEYFSFFLAKEPQKKSTTIVYLFS